MKGYFKYSEESKISFKCFPLSIHQLSEVFSLRKTEIKIINLFVQIFRDPDQENEYLTEGDLDGLNWFTELIQKLSTLGEYSIDELKFEIIENGIIISINDDEIVSIDIDNEKKPMNSKSIMQELIMKMGFKDAGFVYDKLLSHKGSYVCIDEDLSIIEIFMDFSTMSKESKIFI